MIVACVPVAERSKSQVVHLYLAGYTPTIRKSMSRDKVGRDGFVWQHSMCGTVAVNEVHPGNGEPSPWHHEHKTMSEARTIIATGGYLRWCHLCLAHAAREENLLGTMVGLIIDRQVRLGAYQEAPTQPEVTP